MFIPLNGTIIGIDPYPNMKNPKCCRKLMEILVMEKVNDVDTLRCPQTWLENPTCVDDFHGYKPPLAGSFHCHVWLAKVGWYGEPGCWAMEEMLFDSYHMLSLTPSRYSISFVVTATNTCHPRGSGLHGYMFSARWHQPIQSSSIVPHLAVLFLPGWQDAVGQRSWKAFQRGSRSIHGCTMCRTVLNPWDAEDEPRKSLITKVKPWVSHNWCLSTPGQGILDTLSVQCNEHVRPLVRNCYVELQEHPATPPEAPKAMWLWTKPFDIPK